MVRLTALGIGQVPPDVKEAAALDGAGAWNSLLRIELPLASRSILLGFNQTVMASLSMVVVAALIGAGGLGFDVLQALNNVQSGSGVLAGLAIVICAVVPDRILQAAIRRYGIGTV
jgi:ABC-type proline/glycine betaine transport system permease subunit